MPSMDLLSSELDKTISANDLILVMGDINIDNLIQDNKKIKFEEMLYSHGLARLPLPPTRITSHSQTSIDCICTNTRESVVSTEVLKTGLSDHTAQICTITTEMERYLTTQSKRRHFSEKAIEELRRSLQEQDWSHIIQAESVETAYNAFNGIIHSTINATCPLKTVKDKRNPTKNIWDAESQTLKRSYLEALNRELTTGHPDDKRETAQRKKAYDTKLKTLWKQQNADFVERSENKSKAMWRVINNEKKEKSTKSQLEELKIGEELIHSPTNIANHLNNFFVTIADKTLSQNLNGKPPTPITGPNRQPQIPLLTFAGTNEQEIGKIIDTLKSKTSAGEDEMSSKIIKKCKKEIITPLTDIINKSLTQGTFPSQLKLAKVYPKYKGGPTNEPSSYRPISLISTFSKILERKIKSEQLLVNRGVPQGSVLGPVLYILLTNDFPSYLENYCEMVMYADDTALIVASKNKDQLDVDSYVTFNMAKQYCLYNDLVLNASKTQQIINTPRQNYHEGLPEVNTIDSGKYLGIIIDQNLSWEPHVNKLCNKLSSSLYVVRRIKQITNPQVAMTAYYSLFESHMRYGLIAWGGTTATNLHRVLVIQKRAVRTLKGLEPLDTCRAAFKELGILTLIGLYIQETILYAIKTGQTRTGDRHPYHTRHGRNFLLDQHHLSLTEKKPSYRGALFFNTLPDSLRRLPEKEFIPPLKTWFLQRPFYTIQEFLQWRTGTHS
ncbi:uncharacterized protein LOC124369349 [Homalodisca vitripennis]|uniref:uncharacterized protein LOC124369349 n=1 Tax=Homalodisca vitripennis TaxID=197043 RepID=UPI001EE9D794|nr:uncharacterized protein LOC124369349 [Homalodisca vitripennis]